MRRRTAAERRQAPRAPAALAVLAAALGLAAAGCGVASPDLFVVERSGAGAGSRLTLVVSEEGAVRCNGRNAGTLGDHQILEARSIQEGLHGALSHHEQLPAAPGSVFGYAVRDAEGGASFADDSPGQSRALRELQLFVATVARESCHLEG